MASNNNPEEEEKKKKEQQQSWFTSILNFLNPLNWDFGSIFMVLAVVTGGYFLLKSEKVQEWVGGFFDDKDHPGTGKAKVKGFVDNISDTITGFIRKIFPSMEGSYIEKMTPDDVKAAAIKKGETQEVAEAMARNSEKIKAATKLGNNNQLTEEGLSNEKTLFVLLTKSPEVVSDILTASLAEPKTKLTPEQAKKRQDDLAKKLGTLKNIVSDDAMLTELLNDKNRHNVLDIFFKLKPAKPGEKSEIDPKKFEEVLVKKGFDQGTPTKELKELLNTLLTPNAQGELMGKEAKAAVLKFIVTTPASSSTAGTQDPKADKVTADLISDAAVPALGNATNVKVVRKTLGDASFVQFASLSSEEQKSFVMDPDHLPAFKTIAHKINIAAIPDENTQAAFLKLQSIPNAAIAPMCGMLRQGLKPEKLEEASGLFANKKEMNSATMVDMLLTKNVRAIITGGGAANTLNLIKAYKPNSTLPPMLTAANLETLVAAATRIDNNAENKTNRDRTAAVLTGFVEYLTNKNDAPLKQLKPEAIAAFFKIPDNSAAVATILKGLQLSGSQAAMVNALKMQWGDITPDQKRTVAANRDGFGISEILKTEDGAKFMVEHLSGKPNDSAGWIQSVGLWMEGGKVNENSNYVKNLGKALNVQNGTEVAPSQTAAVLTPGNSLKLFF